MADGHDMVEGAQDESPRRSASFVTALARGLSILACFDRPRLELTVSEIARRVGLSQATTWRLCATLIECGYLVRGSASSMLCVGAPALTLGYAAIKGMDFPSIAAPHMRVLSEKTQSSISLSIRRGNEMVAVEQVSGDFLTPNQPVGWSAALTSSSSGLAVLAVLTEKDRQATIEELRLRDEAAWPRRMARIKRAQAQYAHEGHVSVADMFAGQYAAVAIPVIEGNSSAHRYWAISCGGLRSSMNDVRLGEAAEELKHIGRMLQAAAATLPTTGEITAMKD